VSLRLVSHTCELTGRRTDVVVVAVEQPRACHEFTPVSRRTRVFFFGLRQSRVYRLGTVSVRVCRVDGNEERRTLNADISYSAGVETATLALLDNDEPTTRLNS